MYNLLTYLFKKMEILVCKKITNSLVKFSLPPEDGLLVTEIFVEVLNINSLVCENRPLIAYFFTFYLKVKNFGTQQNIYFNFYLFEMQSIQIYFLFQYYEMSYGLNVEMHKQVCFLLLLLVSYSNIT